MEYIKDPEDQLNIVIKPPIYSKGAIMAFSVFFSPVFGGVLLMQNLKDTGRKKEANNMLLLSIGLMVFIVVVMSYLPNVRVVNYVLNLGGGALLSEYFFKKYFPDAEAYGKKKIWKPLIISLAISVAFIALFIWAGEMGIKVQ